MVDVVKLESHPNWWYVALVRFVYRKRGQDASSHIPQRQAGLGDRLLFVHERAICGAKQCLGVGRGGTRQLGFG